MACLVNVNVKVNNLVTAYIHKRHVNNAKKVKVWPRQKQVCISHSARIGRGERMLQVGYEGRKDTCGSAEDDLTEPFLGWATAANSQQHTVVAL